jgi:hypothetical protein
MIQNSQLLLSPTDDSVNGKQTPPCISGCNLLRWRVNVPSKPFGQEHVDHADHDDNTQSMAHVATLQLTELVSAPHAAQLHVAARVTTRDCDMTPSPHVVEHAPNADHAPT